MVKLLLIGKTFLFLGYTFISKQYVSTPELNLYFSTKPFYSLAKLLPFNKTFILIDWLILYFLTKPFYSLAKPLLLYKTFPTPK